MVPHVVLLSLLPSLISALPAIDLNSFSPSSIIHRDVVVVGGGASGTYGAVSLKDKGKSIVIVEAQDRLGGHTQTYTDPATNTTVDYGVVVYNNIDIVKNFFGRFNVPVSLTTELTPPGQKTVYADFRTGKIVAGYTPPNISGALAAYGVQAAKYAYLENGFDLPDPVPADLLLSFEQFVKKFSLQDIVDFAVNFAQGTGDLLSKPVIYLIKYIGVGVLEGIQSGFLSTTRHDNSQVYENAQAELGKDVLLNSRVIATDRRGNDVKVLVKTPNGIKVIVAKKILLTIPPLLNNLVGFDLSSQEKNLFGQFLSNGYWTGLIRNTDIPDNTEIQNIGADTEYHQPVLPALYGIDPTAVPGLYNLKYGAFSASLTDDQVKADILAEIKRLDTAGTIVNSTSSSTPEFAVFSSHSPFELTVTSEAIKGGFYKKLYALQGQRNTYYTGAAFHVHDSALLWRFTEELMDGITAGL
ncbi:hypothetical protein ACLMJK_005660 [Lecanora helva]